MSLKDKRPYPATDNASNDGHYFICFRSFGVEISIEATHSDAIRACRKIIEDSFPTFEFIEHHDRVQHKFRINWNPSANDSLYLNGNIIALRTRRSTVCALLAARLRLTVAEFSDEFVFLHAGAVLWDRKALIFPGPSLHGKTTLVVELVKRGAIYYSDDFAVFDKDGLLLPFTKTVSLRGLQGSLSQMEHDVSDFGGATGKSRAKVHAIVTTKYRPNAKWKAIRISRASGMIDLINNSIGIRQNPEMVMRVLKKVADRAVFVRNERGEAAEAVGSILALLDDQN